MAVEDKRSPPEASFVAAGPAVQAELRAGLVSLSGGLFEMGTRRSTFARDHDSPRRHVRVSPFLISPYAVTNAEYRRFVTATGYRTVAELEDWSLVFHLLIERPQDWPRHPPGLPWWRRVDGANWAAPEGPGSSTAGREHHPVVHVTWSDAAAYCRWAGLRLAREAEWEFAARGGLARKKFPWGNEMMPGGLHRMNTWQGDFPHRNTCDDGHLGTAPVDAFAPNRYGLYNMTGNVWEWVADHFGPPPATTTVAPIDPQGPAHGVTRVQRGGSFLCHASYCDRYQVHSRTQADPESTTSNAGFRVAASV